MSNIWLIIIVLVVAIGGIVAVSGWLEKRGKKSGHINFEPPDLYKLLFGSPNIEKMKSKRDIKGLLKSLKFRKDDLIYTSAASALDELGWQPDNSESAVYYWIARKEWEKCSAIGESAIKPLTEVLHNEKDYGENAANALATIGSAAVKPLISYPCQATFLALVKIGEPSVAPLFETLIRIGGLPFYGSVLSPEYFTRFDGDGIRLDPQKYLFWISRTLVDIGLPCVGYLLSVLSKEEPMLKEFEPGRDLIIDTARGVLMGIGERAIEPLVAAINTKTEYIPFSAIIALANIGEPALEPLLNAMRMKGVDSKIANIISINDSIIDRIRISPEYGRMVFQKCNPASSGNSSLTAFPKSVNWYFQDEIRSLINLVGSMPLVLRSIVRDKTSNSDPAVQRILEMLGKPVYESIIDGITSGDSEVLRFNCIWVIKLIFFGSLKDPVLRNLAINALIAALKDNDSNVRANASEALILIGDVRAVDPLIVSLGDSELKVRKNAVKALGRLGDPKATEPLLSIIRTSTRGVWASLTSPQVEEELDALKKIGTPALDSLLVAIKDNDAFVRKCAAEVLGAIGNERAVESLNIALQDKDKGVRKSATEALDNLIHK